MGKLGTATIVSLHNNFYASLHINYLANLSSLLTLGYLEILLLMQSFYLDVRKEHGESDLVG